MSEELVGFCILLTGLGMFCFGYCVGYDRAKEPRDDLIELLKMEICLLKKPNTTLPVENHRTKPWDCE